MTLLLSLPLPGQAQERLTLLSRLAFDFGTDWSGGFSGAEVSGDGRTLVLLSDRGSLVEARLVRKAGRITDLQQLTHSVLKDAAGQPLARGKGDAEALARDDAGRLWVALEGDHRIALLDPATGALTEEERPALFASFGNNSGIEALAVTEGGDLLALPERSGERQKPFPLLRRRDGAWERAGQIPRRGAFLPTGADLGPEGRLYILERAVSPLGFRSRIRRFDLSTPDLIEETLWSTGPGQFDNLEALTLYRAKDGTLRLLLVSDDNFLSIQRSELIELRLDPGLASLRTSP